MNAKGIKRLIEDVLHSPNFNSEGVDPNMLQRFADSIDSGDLEIIPKHQAGDGAQKLELFKRPAEKVLPELISDIRLAGCQHFGFKEYLDPRGSRLLACHANASVSFQLAQIWIGKGKVPMSLAIYFDSTYIKKSVPIRPIYFQSFNTPSILSATSSSPRCWSHLGVSLYTTSENFPMLNNTNYIATMDTILALNNKGIMKETINNNTKYKQ